MLLPYRIVIIAAPASLQLRLDSSIIAQHIRQKNMTATRHDTHTLNAQPIVSPPRSQGLTAGALA
ncbi:hypothetical protein D9M09_17210 [Janthinobacterium agaricidamnosum]|uniref:Uncharacterized protein n=1 Tax=Janthinobacterium agaricidamnosum TaxID=55508 RepID=A0A3G2EAN3_9BURK|nr:hypothetical protein D9M09_17210 [Janthinobacterium agaricidamnosum]